MQYIYMSSRQKYCNTNLVLLSLGVSEVAKKPSPIGDDPIPIPICDTSGSTKILTTDRGRP